jgi:hypothetical protein
MAIKTYLYRPLSLTAADLDPLLAAGASPVVGDPLPDSQVPITIDSAHKQDLDDAMSSFGYVYVSEYTGGTPLISRSDYGVLAADPTGVTPTNGDMYYNSVLDMEMRYDSVRAKWLSVESATFEWGRSRSVQPGDYFRAGDRRPMSATEGFLAIRSGTVVGLGYTRTDALAGSFDIMANGVSLDTVPTSATGGRSVSLNADFAFTQVLAIRNAPASANNLSNVTGWIRVKWRV